MEFILKQKIKIIIIIKRSEEKLCPPGGRREASWDPHFTTTLPYFSHIQLVPVSAHSSDSASLSKNLVFMVGGLCVVISTLSKQRSPRPRSRESVIEMTLEYRSPATQLNVQPTPCPREPIFAQDGTISLSVKAGNSGRPSLPLGAG